LLIGAEPLWTTAYTTCFDLGEHERALVERDQVDLAVAGADVALQRGETELLKVDHGQLLAEPTERAAGILAAARR